eukprot:scaffold70294_cov30-Tisochrysis_lutea.AAC.5
MAMSTRAKATREAAESASRVSRLMAASGGHVGGCVAWVVGLVVNGVRFVQVHWKRCETNALAARLQERHERATPRRLGGAKVKVGRAEERKLAWALADSCAVWHGEQVGEGGLATQDGRLLDGGADLT